MFGLDPAGERMATAALVGLAYLVFCAGVLGVRRWKSRRAGMARAALQSPGDAAGPVVLVAYASQTGFAEELALRTAAALQAGHSRVDLRPLGTVDAEALKGFSRALFIVSTTGEGDAPDSAARFVARAMASPADLSGLNYGLLALGDRSYAHYCAFGRAVGAWLEQAGARALFETVEANDGDAAALETWREQLGALSGVRHDAAWTPAPFVSWRLAQRRLANPGGPGGEAWHIALSPSGEAPAWEAGDILEIALPPDAAGVVQTRDYSIASLPGDGVAELLVRLMTRPDGSPGLGSGWLIAGAAPGGDISARVRVNSGFRLFEGPAPMILIGNGTGIAGLRAHLKARAAAGHRRNWLIFGERTAAYDRFFGEELDGWAMDGTLERLDLAFSRDVPRAYVQDIVAREAQAVRAWVADGAHIYVCGSLEGMAAGVNAALVEALGPEGLQRLREGGRYRRDVY